MKNYISDREEQWGLQAFNLKSATTRGKKGLPGCDP